MFKKLFLVMGVSVLLVSCSPKATTSNEQTLVEKESATATNTNSAEPVMEKTETSKEASTSEMMAKVVEVEAGGFYYKPAEIRVKKGETVKIVMTSKDMMHDFVIDELNVKMPVVKSGETGTVEFVADTVGTFEYYCSVGKHRAQGQVGKLIVE